MSMKHIKGSPIKPSGGRPANFGSPTSFIHGSPKSVSMLKGNPKLPGMGGGEKFMKSQPHGKVSIKGSVRA